MESVENHKHLITTLSDFLMLGIMGPAFKPGRRPSIGEFVMFLETFTTPITVIMTNGY